MAAKAVVRDSMKAVSSVVLIAGRARRLAERVNAFEMEELKAISTSTSDGAQTYRGLI
jgi:hypothetical protein